MNKKDSEIQQYIIRILRDSSGDDLERAQIAFRNYTEEQLDQQYGQGNYTPRQLLQMYEKSRWELNEAIQWMQQLKL